MNLESEILTTLKPFANPESAEYDQNYLNTEFPTTGASMPAIRKVAKALYKELGQNRTRNQMRIMIARLWKQTSSHDVMTICLLYFSSRKKENALADWRVLKMWASKIDNWAHSDMLSDIYADMLDREENRDALYEEFQLWNSHKHPWKRRLSLTSLCYYSSMRKNPLPAKDILPLVKARLGDEHFYVQRAVGWTLRECGNLHPRPTEIIIKKHVGALSSIAFSTATEKWSKQRKTPLLQQRKEIRKQ